MAGGVIAALKAQGLAGKVPVSGQDGDQAALNSVALGNQTVDVWKDARELGKAAGEAAVRCARTRTSRKVAEHRAVHDARRQHRHRRSCSSRMPITKDNLNVVLDAGLDHQGRPVQGRDRPGPSPPAADALRKHCALPRGSAAGQGAFLFPSRLARRRDERGRPGHDHRDAGARRGGRRWPTFQALEIDTRLLGLILATLAIWVVFNIVSAGLFLTPRNLWNLSVQSAAVAIMATGMVLIIVSRNIDLSVGSTSASPAYSWP